MRIAVIGAGVVGISTAHALARDGHDVTLCDGAREVASGATAATAGLVAPGHSYAWASPAAPRMLLRSIAGVRTPIRVRPRLDPGLLRWGMRFLAECRSSRYLANTAAKFALADYSQRCLTELVRSEDLDVAGAHPGVLYLHRDAESLERAARQGRMLRDLGREQRILDAEEVLRLEPGLAEGAMPFAGAVYDPADGTGDPSRFSRDLLARARARGVRVVTSSRASRLVVEGAVVSRLETAQGPVHADVYVVAAGSFSASLATTAGVRLPIHPAKGYSVSVPWRDGAPRVAHGGIDEGSFVAWSPFDGALRMSATAEFAGFDTGFRDRDFAAIRRVGDELFPHALDWDHAERHAGLRPMTPDGPPYVGPTAVPNLMINAGHGHLGWTMATGSARLVADLVGGREPEIDPTPYSPSRVRRGVAASAREVTTTRTGGP